MEPVRLGVIGLGMAGAVMVYAASLHPGIKLVAAADPQPAPRDAFIRDFGGAAHADAAVVEGKGGSKEGGEAGALHFCFLWFFIFPLPPHSPIFSLPH